MTDFNRNPSVSDRMTESELNSRINREARTIDLTIAVPPASEGSGTLIVLGGFGLTRAVFQNVEAWLKPDHNQ